MPKGSYGLSPNQIENQRKSFEEILAKADALPSPVIPRTVDDMQPLIKKLRDDKGLGWTEIEHWMRQNTEFHRSGMFWKNIYNGKRIGFIKMDKKLNPTLAQPEQLQIENE